jgi:HEAT repeats
MGLNVLKLLSKSVLQSVIVMLMGFAHVTLAKTPDKATDKALTDLLISDNVGSELQLEVREMPLAQVLDDIAHKTKVAIHYSVLPEGLVTATCVGTTLKQVLECLLDRRADLIVRYPHNPTKADSKEQVAEAWILGSRLNGSTDNRANCAATTATSTAKQGNNASLTLSKNEQNAEDEPDQTDDLLALAQSKDSTEREEAIGALLADGRVGDPNVKATLEQALTDKDDSVRAQAISSLSHREGSNAAGAIQDALRDNSVDVRLMAVDSITDDVALLQQAINDSDETVRSLATTKLQQLTQGNGEVTTE